MPGDRGNLFQRIVGAVSMACGVISALMILASVLITCQLVYVRYVMNESTIWQTELVVYLMIGATFLGLSYVQRMRGHVNVDLVPMLLPATARRLLAALTLVLTLVVVVTMIWYGGEVTLLAFERGWTTNTPWDPPQWIPWLAMPLGLGLYLLQLVADLISVASGREAALPQTHPTEPEG